MVSFTSELAKMYSLRLEWERSRVRSSGWTDILNLKLFNQKRCINMKCREYPSRIFFYYCKRLFMEATFGYPWDVSWTSFGIIRVYPDSFLEYPMDILPDKPGMLWFRNYLWREIANCIHFFPLFSVGGFQVVDLARRYKQPNYRELSTFYF